MRGRDQKSEEYEAAGLNRLWYERQRETNGSAVGAFDDNVTLKERGNTQ